MPHWSTISTNPDDPKVLRARRDEVVASQAENIEFFEEAVKVAVAAKRVLDLGYANHDFETVSIGDHSTHDIVLQSASFVLGVDVVDGRLPNSNRARYFTGDALTDVALQQEILRGETIDILFASNVLEHLDNPGSVFHLFQNMVELCGTQKIVVFVPNTLWLIGLFDLHRVSEVDASINVDHVNSFYPGAIVELASRHGCRVTQWAFVGRGDMVRTFAPRPRRTQIFWWFMYWTARKRKMAAAYNQIMFEIELDS